MKFRTLVRALAVGLAAVVATAPNAQAALSGSAPSATGIEVVTRNPASARLATSTEGGQTVFAGGGRCTLGFNVRSGSTYYFVVAGPCASAGGTWYADAAHTIVLGTTSGTYNNTALVRYTNPAITKLGSVHLYPGSRDIVAAGSAYVGQQVCRSGATTGVRCGTVTAVNQTVNFPQGTLSGLVRTTVCSEPGDTGGPFFSGSTALGLTVGGSGNCTVGGVTYFQPISPALSAYGVSVY